MKQGLRFKWLYDECMRHLSVIKAAFSRLSVPEDIENIYNLSPYDEKLLILDQVAYRYLKLQDTMGKLLRAYLGVKGENVENMSMIDVVNLSEKLGVPIDESLWFEMRGLRNSVVHEYPEDVEVKIAALKRIYQLIPRFERIMKSLNEAQGSP